MLSTSSSHSMKPPEQREATPYLLLTPLEELRPPGNYLQPTGMTETALWSQGVQSSFLGVAQETWNSQWLSPCCLNVKQTTCCHTLESHWLFTCKITRSYFTCQRVWQWKLNIRNIHSGESRRKFWLLILGVSSPPNSPVTLFSFSYLYVHYIKGIFLANATWLNLR